MSVDNTNIWRKNFHRWWWLCLGLMVLAVTVQLLVPLVRLRFRFSIDYNEGVNVYHGLAALAGQLYANRSGWTPVDYPPLSFYLVGGMGDLLGDPLLAGRLVSFVSLLLVARAVGRVVCQLRGDRYAAWFAVLLCLGLFAADAGDYVGMNDPQLLGHLFVLAGLLLYLQKRTRLLPVALLCGLGLFVKHNLLPIPLALTIDLFWQARPKVGRWLGYLGGIGAGLILLTLATSGAGLGGQILVGLRRQYSLDASLRSVISIGSPILLPLFISLPLLGREWRVIYQDPLLRVAPIYLILALALDIYTYGGIGTDVNTFFDAFIGLSMTSGLLLALASKQLHTLPDRLHPLYFVLPLLLGSGVLGRAPFQAMTPAIYRQFVAQEAAFQADAAFLAERPGLALCETILLCYAAGKPFVYDPFQVKQMLWVSTVSEEKILAHLQAGYFQVIQLEQPAGLADRHKLAPPGIISSERFSENFRQVLGKYYHLTRRTITGAFYEPNLPTVSP